MPEFKLLVEHQILEYELYHLDDLSIPSTRQANFLQFQVAWFFLRQVSNFILLTVMCCTIMTAHIKWQENFNPQKPEKMHGK